MQIMHVQILFHEICRCELILILYVFFCCNSYSYNQFIDNLKSVN